MTQYRCLKCKGGVQATRTEYLALADTGFQRKLKFDDYHFYCANDCWQHETGGVIDLAKPEDILPDLARLGFIQQGRPQ